MIDSSSAQADVTSYFPTSIGNKWDYYEAHTGNVIVVAQIVLRYSFQINGKTYFYFPGLWAPDTVSTVTDGNVYCLFQGQDQLVYNLSAQVGATWDFTLPLTPSQSRRYTAILESRTDTVSVPAGTFTNCIRIRIRAQGTSLELTDWFAPHVGIVYRGTQIPSELRTALVNGVRYPGATGIGEERSVFKFSLKQNYPNPFNPSTTILYELSKSAHVKLNIFNILGQLAATLVDENKEAGGYEAQWWADVPSGVYFYRLEAGLFVETRKMQLIR